MDEFTVVSGTERAALRVTHRYAGAGRGAVLTVGSPRDGGSIGGHTIALTPEQCREVAAQLIARADGGEL